MVYVWYFELRLGLLIQESDMHPTTFTIESVHGVKQTFVLGPTTKTGNGDGSKQQSPRDAEKNTAADERVSFRRPQ